MPGWFKLVERPFSVCFGGPPVMSIHSRMNLVEQENFSRFPASSMCLVS